MNIDFNRWRALVAERPLISIDTECTDKDALTCGVCEFAAVAYDADCVEKAIAASNPETGLVVLPEPAWPFVQRINPQIPINPDATRVHGITDADVANSPTADTLVAPLASLAASFNVVGFNLLRFDLPILLRVSGFMPQTLSLDVMGLWQNCKTHAPSGRWIGTPGITPTLGLDIARLGIDSFRDTNGAAFAAVFGRMLAGAHGALADCKSTAELLWALLLLFPTLPFSFNELALVAESMLRFVQIGPNGPFFARGKHAGVLVSAINDSDDSYIGWLMKAGDIDEQSKTTVVELLGEARVGQILAAHDAGRGGARRGRKPKAS